MVRRALSLAGAIVIAAHTGCRAESADDVKAALARYFGQSALSVTAAGEAFRVDFDLKALLKALEALGVTIEAAPYAVTLTPNSDGLWQVKSDGLPRLTATIGGQTTSLVTNGQSFEGRFDPRIPAFLSWTGHYDSQSVGVTGRGTDTQTRMLTGGEQRYSASESGDGIIDGKLSQDNASYAQTIVVGDPKAPIDVSIKGGRASDVTIIAGLHVRALTNLWAFFVAHPSFETIKADQAGLRDLLRRALPVFSRLSQDGSLDGLTVTSPIGPFKAGHAASRIATNGLTADGNFELSFSADALTLPTDKLPPWTTQLLPTAVALKTTASGFHLDAAARTLIDAFDLTQPQPIPQATLDALGPMLGDPKDIRIAIGESRITSPTINLGFSGTVVPTQPTPKVELTLHATGLDKAIEKVSEAAKTDASAQQGVALLLLAKGYGKAAPDGALTWDVSLDQDRVITVNGVPLPTENRN